MNTRDTSQSQVSWDDERSSIPERPGFSSSLPEEMIIARPRRLAIAVALALVAAAAVITAIALNALRLETIAEGISAALPDDLKQDYSESDIRSAVNLMLAFIGGAALLLLLMQLLGIASLFRRRSAGARASYVIAVVLMLAVLTVAVIVRDADTLDLALAGVAALGMLLTVVLLCTPRVSWWLRQGEERRPISIATAQDPRTSD